jgi:hypothetical protein
MVQAGGLSLLMQVTPGPYFLGELLEVDVSLSNHSRTTYTLNGSSPSVFSLCEAAVYINMTGGSSAPQFDLLLPDPGAPFDMLTCPMSMSTLAPGQTMRLQEFLPVSSTGTVTLQSGADVVQTVAPDGRQSTSNTSPLDGRWPSITLTVAAATPSDRQITLQQEGRQVQVGAPQAAQAHLYDHDAIMCTARQGGWAAMRTGNW